MSLSRRPRRPMSGSIKHAEVTAVTAAVLAVLGPFSIARAEITSPFPVQFGQFGRAIAIDDDRTIAVSDQPDDVLERVVLFRGGTVTDEWTPVGVLTGSDSQPSDEFGRSIAMHRTVDASGESWLIAVGAPDHNERRGAVYVFFRDVNGIHQIAKLQKPDSQPGDAFGDTVKFSPDGMQLAVAASWDNPTGCGGASGDCPNFGVGRGSVSIFNRISTNQLVYTSDATASLVVGPTARLGSSIQYHPQQITNQRYRLFIGAPFSGSMSDPETGKVFVVNQESLESWSQVGTLSPVSSQLQVRAFGTEIAITPNGSHLAVGAPGSRLGPTGPIVGGIFRFSVLLNSWPQFGTEALPYPSGINPVKAGSSLHFFDPNHLAARVNEPHIVLYRDSVPLSTLTRPTYLGPITNSNFGMQMVSRNGTLLVTAQGQNVNGLVGAGSVILLDAGSGVLNGRDPAPNGGFGSAVAMNTNIALVGNPGPSDSTVAGGTSGRVESWIRQSTGWKRTGTFASPLPTSSIAGNAHRFGASIAIPTLNRAAIGSPGWSRDSGGKPLLNCGAVALLEAVTSESIWVAGGILPFPADQLPEAGELVGTAVAATKSGSFLYVVAGGPGFRSGGLVEAGRVHIWRGPVGGTASQFQRIQVIQAHLPQTGASFGDAVAIEAYSDGSIDLWVGAPGEDVPGRIPGVSLADAGSVYRFRKSPTGSLFTAQDQGVRHAGILAGGRYGSALSMRSGSLAVGAPTADNAGAVDGGRVYAWKRNATSGAWSALPNPLIGTSNPSARLGSSLANTGKVVFVGEPGWSLFDATELGQVRQVKFTTTGFAAVNTTAAEHPRIGDGYGQSVAAGAGSTVVPIIVGSPKNDDGDIVDAGIAFGFVEPQDPCIADIDFDFNVGPSDLSLLIAEWGPQELGRSMADLDESGAIDGYDLAILLTYWEACSEE